MWTSKTGKKIETLSSGTDWCFRGEEQGAQKVKPNCCVTESLGCLFWSNADSGG